MYVCIWHGFKLWTIKNIIHTLQSSRTLLKAFSLSFMCFTLSWYIVYVARNYRPVRIFPVRAYSINFKNIPCIIARRVLTLSRYWALQNRPLLKFSWFLYFMHVRMQFSFVVPTVECIRGYDIDLTIYSLFWTSQMMFVLWWSPERFLKSLSLSCKNVLFSLA